MERTLFDSIDHEAIAIHHATKAKAERLASAFADDYPALSLYADTDEGRVSAWVVIHTDIEEGTDSEAQTEVCETPKVPDLADVLDLCIEMGVDPEIGLEDEDKAPSGSVVPETYRARYREASTNGQTCGDWLAEQLVSDTHSIEGFVVEDFTAILNANGVDMSARWAQLPFSGQKGWIGRYRMNGRQVLEKAVAKSGVYISAGYVQLEPPAPFLASLRERHAKWLAKQAKQEAAAAEVAKGADDTAA